MKLTLILLTALCLLSPCLSAALEGESIVPPRERMSDDEARLALARILSYNDAGLKDSLAEYTILLTRMPEDAEIALEAAGVMTRLGQNAEAASVLGKIFREHPRDTRIMIALADAECGLQHARACRDLYLKALDITGNPPDLRLRFADHMNMWGDFYRSGSIYREHLKAVPGDPDVLLKLAGILASSERYEEAAEIYGGLISGGRKRGPALIGLARTKLWEKDAAACERYAGEAMQIEGSDNIEAALLLAESHMMRGEPGKARSVYEEIIARRGATPDLLTNIGIAHMREGNSTEASRWFRKAGEMDTGSLPAAFYAGWPDTTRSRAFTGSLLKDPRLTAADLARWAELYVSQGDYIDAVQCYDAALDKDPSLFPASIGRAQALASGMRYEEAIAAYAALSREFPDNVKIMTGEARTLAWARRYNESVQIYRRMIAIDPRNPVPLREMARTHMWAKEPTLAMDAYDNAIARFTDPKDSGISEKTDDFSSSRRIRRSIALEKDAKRLAYEKRFSKSLPVYETLIRENPGNEEALFDEAQVACALGLCKMEGDIYDRLLTIDPMHSLARESRDWQRSRGNASLRFDYSYWNEEGRGDLARITRNRFDLTADVPVQCQYHIFLKGHRWLEQPDFDHQTYGASGFSLGFGGAFTPALSGEFSFTHKRYDRSGLGNKETGYGTLWYAIDDRLKLGLGYARTDELYNYFGIDQGVQANRYWLGFRSDITRKLELSGRGEYITYTDSNSGVFAGLTTGYALTDHPREFKISAAGEYRNTRHNNEYIYSGGNLMDIIHPYWAPRSYFAGSLIFGWRHDLASLFICGGGQHFYDIKASFGTDTENNPYAKLEGEWNFEFTKHWLIGLKGLIHSSPEWDALGAFALLRYRF